MMERVGLDYMVENDGLDDKSSYPRPANTPGILIPQQGTLGLTGLIQGDLSMLSYPRLYCILPDMNYE